MQVVLVLLLLLNLSLLAVNLLPKTSGEMPLTEPEIPGLELVTDAPPAAYSSASGITSSCYTIGPYTSKRAAEQVMAKIRNYNLGVQMRSLQTMETLNYLSTYRPCRIVLKPRKWLPTCNASMCRSIW